MRELGAVAALRRYPVKSMLGQDLTEAVLTSGGVEGDRVRALIDVETGRVATAKHPRLWRALLRLTAARHGEAVSITLPDGRTVDADDADQVLSELLGRKVTVASVRPDGASVARPDPEDVLAHGADADVPYQLLQIGQGTTGGTFVDYAPVHLISTTTLRHVGAEWVRYRPNLLLDTPSAEPFAENSLAGKEITIGSVRLRCVMPTPRCAVPTLEHGDLPRAPHAVRRLLEENRVDVSGFGVLPCAGVYADVVTPGTIHQGDPVAVS